MHQPLRTTLDKASPFYAIRTVGTGWSQKRRVKEKVIDELRLSVSIVLSREEVVPRFRVMCPEGDWTVFVPLPDDIGERQRRMQLIYGFMAWKSATGFVMSSELRCGRCCLMREIEMKLWGSAMA